MTTVIHIDGAEPLRILDERGWVQGVWESDGGVCAHQAIRMCQPVPGDAYLIERVSRRWGRGTGWNDATDTTEADVRAWFAGGIDVTDEDLSTTFGPQWRAVVSLVRRCAAITSDEFTPRAVQSLREILAQDAALGAARVVARYAAVAAAWDAARVAAWDAARVAASDATLAVATWDLATESGRYTFAHRDLLIGPWRKVCGLPEGLIERAAGAE